MVIVWFLLLFVVGVGALFYFWNRFHRFHFVQEIAKEHKKLSWLVAFLPVLLLVFLFLLKTVYATVISLHLLFFWLFCDFVSGLVKKIRCRRMTRKIAEGQIGTGEDIGGKVSKIYLPGIFAILITAVYLCIGWYYAHHVYETHYTVKTEKDLDEKKLRIVQISDSHIGSTFDGKGFAGYMKRVQKTEPDLVVITGDYVDDDTKRADMEEACQALGGLRTTYGVFFVYGNHDKGYFQSRDFTAEELEEELEKNQVTVLQDDVVKLSKKLVLVGRKDRSAAERKNMEELLSGSGVRPEEEYVIVLDHQPHDFINQEKTGVDLVLCGHTHGGQMFPVGITGELSGENDKTYGLEKRGNTNFIVNSGISDWAIPFKTAAISEYGVIDVIGNVD